MLDLYGLSMMDYRAIQKEIKSLTKLARVHHIRCDECVYRMCRNPYRIIIERFQLELSLREAPITWRSYIVKVYRSLVKGW